MSRTPMIRGAAEGTEWEGPIAADKPSVLGHRVRVFTRYGDAPASEGCLHSMSLLSSITLSRLFSSVP